LEAGLTCAEGIEDECTRSFGGGLATGHVAWIETDTISFEQQKRATQTEDVEEMVRGATVEERAAITKRSKGILDTEGATGPSQNVDDAVAQGATVRGVRFEDDLIASEIPNTGGPTEQ
jgi:hypothetical protein